MREKPRTSFADKPAARKAAPSTAVVAERRFMSGALFWPVIFFFLQTSREKVFNSRVYIVLRELFSEKDDGQVCEHFPALNANRFRGDQPRGTTAVAFLPARSWPSDRTGWCVPTRGCLFEFRDARGPSKLSGRLIAMPPRVKTQWTPSLSAASFLLQTLRLAEHI